jgi:hypothetical protein
VSYDLAAGAGAAAVAEPGTAWLSQTTVSGDCLADCRDMGEPNSGKKALRVIRKPRSVISSGRRVVEAESWQPGVGYGALSERGTLGFLSRSRVWSLHSSSALAATIKVYLPYGRVPSHFNLLPGLSLLHNSR